MATVATRLATSDDLESVATLFDAYRQFYDQTPDLARARQFIGERFERGESVLVVAESGTEKLVGFCQLYPTFCSVRAAPTFVLYDLFVTPAARGTGAGKALMIAAESHARASGAARIELSTARSNRVAQALYESLGWQRDEDFYVYGKTL
jgi:ribosomal protein S18 acetylase RimI-like enzyme